MKNVSDKNYKNKLKEGKQKLVLVENGENELNQETLS